jgi:hypothetical protein
MTSGGTRIQRFEYAGVQVTTDYVPQRLQHVRNSEELLKGYSRLLQHVPPEHYYLACHLSCSLLSNGI